MLSSFPVINNSYCYQPASICPSPPRLLRFGPLGLIHLNLVETLIGRFSAELLLPFSFLSFQVNEAERAFLFVS